VQLCAETIVQYITFCQATATSTSTYIINRDVRLDRSIDLSERLEKIGNVIAEYHHVIVLPSIRRIPQLQPQRIRTRDLTELATRLEIYLCFDEAPSYPRYFLRKHKSPTGIVY